MRALILGENGPYLETRAEKPRPGPGEVLLRVRCAGICSTDLELIRGYAGFRGILGHEFVAEVVEAAGEARSWLGKRVVGSINLACRSCAECVGFGPEHCPRRTVLGIIGKDGAFADYLTLPATNLYAVPDEVDDHTAVFTEPVAAALRLRDQLTLPPDAAVAVVGPGRLGLLVAQVLALAGGRPTVYGRREASLVLPQQLGLETGLVADAPSDGFDLVVEATGNAEGLRQSLRLVRPRGTLALKSTFHGEAQVDLTKIVVAELRILGSRCGPFAPALRLLARRQIAVAPLMEAVYPLDQALAALEHAARPGVRKILLTATG